MADPKLPTPDEVAEQSSKEEKDPNKKKTEGKKYDGGEIPKQ